MLMRKEENVLRQQSGVNADIVLAESGGSQGSTRGDLTITNQRVIFESTSGLLSKKTTTVIDCPLEDVANVSIEGLIGKKLVLQLPMGLSAESRVQSLSAAMVDSVQCKVSFGVKDPIEWERAVREAVAGY